MLENPIGLGFFPENTTDFYGPWLAASYVKSSSNETPRLMMKGFLGGGLAWLAMGRAQQPWNRHESK